MLPRRRHGAAPTGFLAHSICPCAQSPVWLSSPSTPPCASPCAAPSPSKVFFGAPTPAYHARRTSASVNSAHDRNVYGKEQPVAAPVVLEPVALESEHCIVHNPYSFNPYSLYSRVPTLRFEVTQTPSPPPFSDYESQSFISQDLSHDSSLTLSTSPVSISSSEKSMSPPSTPTFGDTRSGIVISTPRGDQLPRWGPNGGAQHAHQVHFLNTSPEFGDGRSHRSDELSDDGSHSVSTLPTSQNSSNLEEIVSVLGSEGVAKKKRFRARCPTCSTTADVKRLRFKRGFTYFVCLRCHFKWRVPGAR